MEIIAIAAIIGLAVLAMGLRQAKNPNDTGVDVRASDGSLTGSEITQDVSTWPGSDRVWEICSAIALAEGFDDGPGAVPFDLNNPGDISDYSATYGFQPHSGSKVTTFPTAEVGWQKLYEKVDNMVHGRSSVYSGKTWTQVAQTWAGDWQNWLNNVTSYLGVSVDSSPSEYISGVSGSGGSF